MSHHIVFTLFSAAMGNLWLVTSLALGSGGDLPRSVIALTLACLWIAVGAVSLRLGQRA